MTIVQSLSLLAIVSAVFLVMFGAFHVRRAGWSSLLLGLLGTLLLLLVAVYSPALIAVGDRLLQVSRLPLTASAHASVSSATQAPRASAQHLIKQTGSHSAPQTHKRTTQPAVQAMILDAFLPVVQWLLGSLLLGVLLFMTAIIAIQRRRSKAWAFSTERLHGRLDNESQTSLTRCPRCLERRHHLAKYAWHIQEGKTSGLLCARCAQQLEAIELS